MSKDKGKEVFFAAFYPECVRVLLLSGLWQPPLIIGHTKFHKLSVHTLTLEWETFLSDHAEPYYQFFLQDWSTNACNAFGVYLSAKGYIRLTPMETVVLPVPQEKPE